MDLYTIDVETYYSSADEYSLRKMPMVDYIMDPRFELISLSYKRQHDDVVFLFGEDAEEWLRTTDTTKLCMLGQNTQFDAAVLAWRYGKKFAMYLDTLAMANAVVRPFTTTGRVGLASIAKHFGLPDKGDFVLKTDGKRRADVDDVPRLADYNNHDVMLTWSAFLLMKEQFPISELMLIDQIVRLYIEPRLALKPEILATALQDIKLEKQRLLDEAGLSDRTILMSNDKLAAVLGLLLGSMDKLPMKTSKKTGKRTYAFSKKDRKFAELTEHPNEAVANIVAARLGHKSTLLETRTEKLLGIAHRHRSLAVPLIYWGAHTGRLSGGGGLNLQNLTRGSAIRYAIEPLEDDHVLVVVDASQIEARFLVTWAGQWDVVRQFARKEDVYAIFAEKIYGRPIDKDTDPDERFVGKVAVLSLGYGAGVDTFFDMLWSSRTKKQIAAGFAPDKVLAQRVVQVYRVAHGEVSALWRTADYRMMMAMRPEGMAFSHGPFYFEPGQMTLPNGMKMYYPDLRQLDVEDEETGETRTRWFYGHGAMKKTLYGPKLVENATQAATRIIITDAWLDLRKRWPVSLQVHDELLFAVKSKEAERCLEASLARLSQPPAWMPNIPLNAEGGIGKVYGEIK